jgi:hypothetical protein
MEDNSFAAFIFGVWLGAIITFALILALSNSATELEEVIKSPYCYEEEAKVICYTCKKHEYDVKELVK